MAKKRMFSMQIVDSDAFCDLPADAQALYFHLNMRADDDGFVGNPKKIVRLLALNDESLKILADKHFILTFDSGVICIKHWFINNTIKSDRYVPTVYEDERLKVYLKQNNSYTFDKSQDSGKFFAQKNIQERFQNDGEMETECFQNVSDMEQSWKQNGNNTEPSCHENDAKKETVVPLNTVETLWKQNGTQMETFCPLDKNRLDKNKLNLKDKASIKTKSMTDQDIYIKTKGTATDIETASDILLNDTDFQELEEQVTSCGGEEQKEIFQEFKAILQKPFMDGDIEALKDLKYTKRPMATESPIFELFNKILRSRTEIENKPAYVWTALREIITQKQGQIELNKCCEKRVRQK